MLSTMSASEFVYQTGIYAARPLLALAAPLSPKLRKGLQGRRGAADRLTEWARTQRDSNRPLIWLHAPSVGESLMAQAIAAELRQQLADVQLAFTYFSPSAERVSQKVGADIAEYM